MIDTNKNYKKLIDFHYNNIIIELLKQLKQFDIHKTLELLDEFSYDFLVRRFHDLYVNEIDIKKIKEQYSNIDSFQYDNEVIIQDYMLNIDNFLHYFFSNNDYKIILENDLINGTINMHRYLNILKKLLLKEFEYTFIKKKSFDVNISRIDFIIFKFDNNINYNSEYIKSYISEKRRF